MTRDAGTIRAIGEIVGQKGKRTFTLELDPTFAADPTEPAHRKLPLYRLISARDHGVTGGFARRVRSARPAAGLDEVIAKRDRGERP